MLSSSFNGQRLFLFGKEFARSDAGHRLKARPSLVPEARSYSNHAQMHSIRSVCHSRWDRHSPNGMVRLAIQSRCG
jgi:hypothetical protein